MAFLNLDLDTLRTLVVAHDLGGYGQAAQRLGRTPSAISLQMKRLQGELGAALFRKRGRGVALTEAGDVVLRYGRRILALNDELIDTVRGTALVGRVRLGVAQDFADAVLPLVLARFAALYPRVVMEVRIEGNAALVDAVERGEIDVVLAIGHEGRPTAHVLGEIELGWIAGREFSRPPDAPLPLLLLGPQCAFRQEAVRQLDAAGVPWRIAATSPSLAAIWASAAGGLGVTVRSRLALPPALVWEHQLCGLPRLRPFAVTLHVQPHLTSESGERLRAIIGDAVAQALPAVDPSTGDAVRLTTPTRATHPRSSARPAPRAAARSRSRRRTR